VVSYTDASILVYDTRTGEEIVGMASLETYDGTPSTGVNSVVATTVGFDGSAHLDPNRTMAEEEVVHGATGSSSVEGVIISGYEDRYIRFFDANSGMLHFLAPFFLLKSFVFLTHSSRSMYVHYAGPSGCDCLVITVSGWM
jgi:striatin 1/3/4